jgi:hypothetical protein
MGRKPATIQYTCEADGEVEPATRRKQCLSQPYLGTIDSHLVHPDLPPPVPPLGQTSKCRVPLASLHAMVSMHIKSEPSLAAHMAGFYNKIPPDQSARSNQILLEVDLP